MSTAHLPAAALPLAEALIECARRFHAQGYSPATSSNYSARLDDGHALITRSGLDKGALTPADFLIVDLAGTPQAGSPGKPSAETLLHTLMYRREPRIGCVLHTHSPRGVVLSRALAADELRFEGWELQKAFHGITTHDGSVAVPIVGNDQDMARLAAIVEPRLPRDEPCFGYLLRGHGLYAWGPDVATTARHVDAFEYLFECELELLRLRR